jgi:gliding motility-associated-like protein
MKRLIAFVLFTAFVVFAFNCKKNKSTTNTAYCKTCSTTLISYKIDTDSVYYFLPTAFTPNGDGINDIFSLVFHNLVVDSSTLTIWDMSGNEVFSGNIGTRWDGRNLSGNKCAAGNYLVHVYLRTNKGVIFSTCACVTILQYTGNCIKTNGITYYFPDQLNIDSGFVFHTNDVLCP